MNHVEFDAAKAQLAAERLAVVLAKQPEYTEGKKDVFHNFKIVAEELGIRPEQVWYVYFRKHISSICTACKNPDAKLAEPIEGRIGDAMNYLELLYGMIKEKQIVLPVELPPRRGRLWHVTFTPDMLPEGYRPLLLGEKPMEGDEVYNGNEWVRQTSAQQMIPAGEGDAPQRTTRPLQ